MAESKILTSFAAGELSKNLYARVDIDQFQVGAALLRNFFVDWRGGASNRPGTKYVNICKQTGARLMPFDFNTSITYMMEFGGGYIRFYTSGQPVLEEALPALGFTNANPGVWFIPNHGYSVGDEVVLTAPNMLDFNDRQLIVGAVVDANNVSFTSIFGSNIDTTAETFAGPVSSSRIYTLASPYLSADLFDLNFVQSADVVTIVHPNYVPYNLSRVSASQFQLVADVPGPIIQPPTGLVGSSSVSGAQNYGYVVTALNQDGSEESIMSVPVVVQSKLLDPTASPAVQITLNWTAPVGLVVSAYNIYKWGPITRANGTPPTVFGYIGQTKALSFTDNNIAADFSKVPDEFADPFSTGQIENISVLTGGAYTSGGSVSYVPLTISGDGTGAAGYAMVNYATGAVVGAFITSPGKGYTTASVTAGTGGATFSVQISPESGTFPSVVSYVQERRSYAAANNDPQAITMSQTGNYDNFNVSPVVADSDAITIRLASTEVDFIQSMTPMSTGLVILTSGGAWLLSGGTPGAPITPSETTATRQASHGANRLPPIVWNYDLLYMQQKGNTVRDLAFNFYLQSYVGNDRSYLSQHLFTNYNFVQWAAAEEPLKLIWIVRSDGVMLSMTYLPEQEVYGWAHHDTQGLFRSVATVSEGTVDAVYVIVSRYVQPGADCGSGWYDFIERLDDRKFDCTEDVWFLDSALSNEKEFPAFTIFDSGPIGTIGGNVEICAAPSTNLYGGSGLNSPSAAAFNYVASSNAPLHYCRGNFDFDGNRMYHEQATAGSDPGTNGHSLFVFNIQTRQQIAGPIAPGELALASPGQTCMGYDGNVYYGTSDNANLVGFMDGQTFANTIFNNTGGPELAAVGAISVITDGVNQFAICTGLNSGQDSAPCFIVQMTGGMGPVAVNNPVIPGQPFNQYFDELPGSIAPGNGIPIRGPTGCAYTIYIGPPGGVGTTQLGLYLIQVVGTAGTGQWYKTKLGVVLPTAVDAAWTTINVESVIYDETDGNLLALLIGSNNNYYMCKISTKDASILWKNVVGSSVSFYGSRVRHGLFNFVGPDAIMEFNTLTGAVNSVSESLIGPGTQVFDDNTGQIVVQINNIGTTDWATFGPASPTAWAAPGQIVQIGCGKIQVVTNDTPWESHGTVVTPITNAIPNDPTGTVGMPVTDFSVATPTNVMTGLWHLEGKTVSAVADGQVFQDLTVTNGKVTLPNGFTATNIVVGLSYQSQLQTLYLDAPGPNMQGKRKTVPAATLRLADSRGPKIGRTFDTNDLVEMQSLMVLPGVTPMPLVTGDFREALFSDWETTGQLCVQQDYPLPLTVLGIIPEFVRGDTAN
jgi:hypothetical protein